MVVVNREPADGTGTPVVTADYRSGLIGLLELLYADGHRSLMFLAGAPQSASNTRGSRPWSRSSPLTPISR